MWLFFPVATSVDTDDEPPWRNQVAVRLRLGGQRDHGSTSRRRNEHESLITEIPDNGNRGSVKHEGLAA